MALVISLHQAKPFESLCNGLSMLADRCLSAPIRDKISVITRYWFYENARMYESARMSGHDAPTHICRRIIIDEQFSPDRQITQFVQLSRIPTDHISIVRIEMLVQDVLLYPIPVEASETKPVVSSAPASMALSTALRLEGFCEAIKANPDATFLHTPLFSKSENQSDASAPAAWVLRSLWRMPKATLQSRVDELHSMTEISRSTFLWCGNICHHLLQMIKGLELIHSENMSHPTLSPATVYIMHVDGEEHAEIGDLDQLEKHGAEEMQLRKKIDAENVAKIVRDIFINPKANPILSLTLERLCAVKGKNTREFFVQGIKATLETGNMDIVKRTISIVLSGFIIDVKSI